LQVLDQGALEVDFSAGAILARDGHRELIAFEDPTETTIDSKDVGHD
jgi:hypothetical protein